MTVLGAVCWSLTACSSGSGGSGGNGGGGGGGGGGSGGAARITLLTVGTGSGDLPIRVRVDEPDSKPVDLLFELSRDGGDSWHPVRLEGAPSLAGLSSAVDGVEHEVLWQTLDDLGFRSPTGCRLRCTPSTADGPGTPAELELPPIDNRDLKVASVEDYLVHYGALDADTIALAEQHDLVIVHPQNGGFGPEPVREIMDGVDPDDPADDVMVLAYISVGEDIRTIALTDQQMAADARFVGDGSGPRVDPRGPDADGGPLTGLDPLGAPSPGGNGYASWYLDDNSVDNDPNRLGDGLPDRNSIFGGCFVNAGDPAWFTALDTMTMDGVDAVAGIRELLSGDYGRGYACDGLFLDTFDTCAPNFYTDGLSPNQSEFEWTAGGFRDFLQRLRDAYPRAVVLQNRGLFLFDPRMPHYAVKPAGLIDFLKYESFRLDSSRDHEFHPYFFPDNKHNIAPKIMAEAQRDDGFLVLSLGYAEGPPGSIEYDTLLGDSTVGMQTLIDDIHECEDLVGMRHYITDAGVVLPNRFVLDHRATVDEEPPVWSSVYNANVHPWPTPPDAPDARAGIQEIVPGNGQVTLRWDVALDRNPVGYALYYGTVPFDFVADPSLTGAERVVLSPRAPADYGRSTAPQAFPFEATISGLQNLTRHWFCIRAFDSLGNEDDNQRVLTAAPYGQVTITIDGQFDDWALIPDAVPDLADSPDSAGPDWLGSRVVHDGGNVFVRCRSEHAFNLDGSPTYGFSRTLVLIDCDDDPNTGYAFGGIGSELLLAGDTLYSQAAGVFNAGFLQTIAIAPTTNVTAWEFAIPRSRIDDAAPGTRRIRIVLLNDETYDQAPDTGGHVHLLDD